MCVSTFDITYMLFSEKLVMGGNSLSLPSSGILEKKNTRSNDENT